MKINRVEFLNALKFLKPAICQNDLRRNLMCVHCLSQGERMQMTATNSFIIKRVTLNGKSEIDSEYMITSKQIDDIMTICEKHKGKKSNWPFYRIDIEPEKFVSGKVLIEIEQPQREFPNLDRLFSPQGGGTDYFGITGRLLIDVLKGFDHGSGRRRPPAMKITCKSKESPILIEQDQTTYQAVIMPVITN